MTESSENSKRFGTSEAMDSVILLFSQLIQPATAREVSKLLCKDPLFSEFPEAKIAKAFSRLESCQFLWRTADSRYIVTPKAEQLIRSAMKHARRDRIRLFTLNKIRYRSV